MNTHVFQPNKRATLYDARKDTQLSGVLYFKKDSVKPHTNSIYTRINFTHELVGSKIAEENTTDFLTQEAKVHSTEIKTHVYHAAFLIQFVRHILGRIKVVLLFITELYVDFCVQFFGLLMDIGKVIRRFSINSLSRSDGLTVRYYGSSLQNPLAAAPSFPSRTLFPANLSLLKKLLSFNKSFFSAWRLPVALVCLVLAFVSMGMLLFPLISAQLFAGNPSQSVGVASPTPLRYNSYYHDSTDPLYPIREFRLSVPKINLESNIVDNVDPNIEGEYKDKLQFGVAHAKGSYLPPEKGGPVYLFAHSTDTIFNIARFNAKFYSVRELEAGDEIKVFFNGKEYRYQVTEKFIINPHEVDVVKNAIGTDLILQTCWPPGTDWQRLIVYANLIEDSASSSASVQSI